MRILLLSRGKLCSLAFLDKLLVLLYLVDDFNSILQHLARLLNLVLYPWLLDLPVSCIFYQYRHGCFPFYITFYLLQSCIELHISSKVNLGSSMANTLVVTKYYFILFHFMLAWVAALSFVLCSFSERYIKIVANIKQCEVQVLD